MGRKKNTKKTTDASLPMEAKYILRDLKQELDSLYGEIQKNIESHCTQFALDNKMLLSGLSENVKNMTYAEAMKLLQSEDTKRKDVDDISDKMNLEGFFTPMTMSKKPYAPAETSKPVTVRQALPFELGVSQAGSPIICGHTNLLEQLAYCKSIAEYIPNEPEKAIRTVSLVMNKLKDVLDSLQSS